MNANHVGSLYPDSFGSFGVAQAVTVSVAATGNAVAQLPVVGGSTYIVRRITVANANKSIATANVTIELNTNTTGNISNASWAVVVANNTGGLFIADGTNVRANVLSGTPTITLFTVNGGQDVSGTYNV